jgi:hypothetical protein
MSWIIPYLPFLGIVLAVITPIFLMRLNAKQLQTTIDKGLQDIRESKARQASEQADALDVLDRVAKTTAEELEKSLQKSITMRNLLEQVNLQNSQIAQQKEIIGLLTQKGEQLTIDLATQNAARLVLEDQVKDLNIKLAEERDSRQTVLAAIENLKGRSDNIVQKLTARVKKLENFIRSKGFSVADADTGQDNEEVENETGGDDGMAIE